MYPYWILISLRSKALGENLAFKKLTKREKNGDRSAVSVFT